LKRQPIFSADRGHIHHRLLDRGLTPRRAVLLLYAICSVVAVLSLVANMVENDNRLSAFVIVLFCAVTWIGIQYLGYAEFSVAGRMIFRGDFQRSLKGRMDLIVLEQQFADAQSLERCWKLACEAAPKFGFHCLRMEVGETRFEDMEAGDAMEDGWICRIPLGRAAFIELTRNRQATAQAFLAGPFADGIQAGLGKHVEKLRNETAEVSLGIRDLAGSESAS
jgi:UDP-GlcNAc:undecaprenyl-phosphate GlcNAc-1-phosphate transferase